MAHIVRLWDNDGCKVYEHLIVEEIPTKNEIIEYFEEEWGAVKGEWPFGDYLYDVLEEYKIDKTLTEKIKRLKK
jgi:hypothetical protein